jgi:carbon storage regulator CsrA
LPSAGFLFLGARRENDRQGSVEDRKMLVLQRRIGQSLIVNHRITVTVKGVRGKVVSIGIEAPKEVRIRRGELPQETTPRFYAPAWQWHLHLSNPAARQPNGL